MQLRGSAKSSGVVVPRNPTTGIAGCCARETSGHTTAAPPTSAMKSRRLTDVPPPWAEDYTLPDYRLRTHFVHHSTSWSLMSALGQKQTLGHVRAMSALPPKADIETRSRNVCFVPKADIGAANSITSLAVPSNKPRPSALAVLRLTTYSRKRTSDPDTNTEFTCPVSSRPSRT
jgi:hypothetical protein